MTDLKPFVRLANKYEIPLLVDEAHGQHLAWTTSDQPSALVAGADIVIHSLHKTLSCLTQTGLVHLCAEGIKRYGFSTEELRACLNLIQSSSPSYLMLNSIDKLVSALGDGRAQKEIQKMDKLGLQLKESLKERAQFDLYQSNPGTTSTHVLIKHKELAAETLNELLQQAGIFPETILGAGVLLLLGIGSQESDVGYLIRVLDQICPGNGGQYTSGRSKPRPYGKAPWRSNKFILRKKSLPCHRIWCPGKKRLVKSPLRFLPHRHLAFLCWCRDSASIKKFSSK